jgi:hypothetical protein
MYHYGRSRGSIASPEYLLLISFVLNFAQSIGNRLKWHSKDAVRRGGSFMNDRYRAVACAAPVDRSSAATPASRSFFILARGYSGIAACIKLDPIAMRPTGKARPGIRRRSTPRATDIAASHITFTRVDNTNPVTANFADIDLLSVVQFVDTLKAYSRARLNGQETIALRIKTTHDAIAGTSVTIAVAGDDRDAWVLSCDGRNCERG